MSGMKFRRTCSACNATFFSPDRKASLCLKCSKKRVIKHVRASAATEVKAGIEPLRVAPRPGPHAAPPMHAPRQARGPRPPKASLLTSDLRQRISDYFQQECGNGGEVKMREVHALIAEKLWVKRKLVADVLRDVAQTKVE